MRLDIFSSILNIIYTINLSIFIHDYPWTIFLLLVARSFTLSVKYTFCVKQILLKFTW